MAEAMASSQETGGSGGGLCTAAEQRLWAELSVFPGSFGPEAVEHVCGPGALGTLARLVEKSVVCFSPQGAGPGTFPQGPGPGARPGTAGRYAMLDTMREFGAERLADAEPVRARHRDYYLGLARAAAGGSMTAAQPAWLAALGAETANFRVALGYSFACPAECAAGLELTMLLRPYWLMTGQFTEGRRWHDAAVAVSPGSAANGWALFGAGMLAVQQGDLEAGAAYLGRAAALAGEFDDEDLAAHVADGRGVHAMMSGDCDAARSGHEAALAVYERIGFTDPLALVSYARLAGVFLILLDPECAAAPIEECLRRCAPLGEQWAHATALWVRGVARWMSGDVPAAIADTLACLRMKEPLGDLHTVAMCFDLLSVCLVTDGEHDRAAVLHGAADALWRLLKAPTLMGPGYAEIRGNAAATARRELGDDRFWALYRQGEAMPLPAALATARAGLAVCATASAPGRRRGPRR